jgi:disulfide bond formation protein DsbB
MAADLTPPADRREDRVYTVLAGAVLAMAALPVGIAVFVLGFVYGDSPCVMCWEQRTGMALIALIGLFILRYGAKPRYVGLAVLVGAWGIFMAIRHTAMHAGRDVGQGFSAEIFGAHTYTWALVIYWVVVVTISALLMLLEPRHVAGGQRRLRPLESLAMVVFLAVIGGNIVQAFASTGPPPFMGQSDPIRFSFNPRHWVWSLDEYSPAPVSLRGRWAIEKPGLAGLPADPGTGPLGALPALDVKRTARLALALRGTPTDLAYDAASDRFLVTTEHGVHMTDGALSRVTRYTVVDPGFSVDLGRFAGGAFLDSHTVIAVGENKSFVVLKESDKADPDANFRYFLESFDQFTEARRSRFGTVRARMMYAMSAAYDARTKSFFTVTVPNAKVKGFVVSRFGADYVLSEEFTPALAAESGLKLGAKRKIDELYVTGAACADGRLYALSAAYSTLLTIDVPSRAIVAAHAIPGLSRPVGLAVKGDELYIVGEDGSLTVTARPAR